MIFGPSSAYRKTHAPLVLGVLVESLSVTDPEQDVLAKIIPLGETSTVAETSVED